MINVAICENNAMQIKYVVDVINKYSIKENMDFMIDKFISGEELLNSNHSKYNVIFLEIKMNGISGIDTAKKIRETNEEVKIIFLTSSKELWAEAFKVNAFRYLVKPVKEKGLYNEISTVVNEIKRNNKYIILNYNNEINKIFISNIRYLEIENRKVVFHCNSANYYSMRPLSYWNEVLTKYNFYKPHSSYLVNLKYISKINKELLELSTGEIIYFSKRKYKEFKEKYMEYIISEI